MLVLSGFSCAAIYKSGEGKGGQMHSMMRCSCYKVHRGELSSESQYSDGHTEVSRTYLLVLHF